MKEKMNQAIENTLRNICVEVLQKFYGKHNKGEIPVLSIQPFPQALVVEIVIKERVCRRIFEENNSGDDEMKLISDWKAVSDRAKFDAIKMVFGI